MRNTYSPWRDLGGQPDLELVWRELPTGLLGKYEHHLRRITLDPRMPRRQSRCVLAHELVHAEHGDMASTCARHGQWQERRADHKAARRLIHIDDLGDAMIVNDNHLGSMAVDLRVSDAMLRIRRDILTKTERLQLRRRLRENEAA